MPTIVQPQVTVNVPTTVPLPLFAVIATCPDGIVFVVLTVNVVLLWPAATLTDGGKVSFEEELCRVTIIPDAGAGPEIVSVPVDVPPALIWAGLNARDTSTGGTSVRTVVLLTNPLLAMIVTDFLVDTGFDVTAKAAESDPAVTVTDFGTDTARSLLESTTWNPPVNASAVRATKPLHGLPPASVDGLALTPARLATVSEMVADC